LNLKPHISKLKLILSFIIPFIALMIIVPKYTDTQINQTVMALFAVVSLGMVGILQLYRLQGHQGNSPMFIGGAILLLSGVPLLASISVQGSTQLIELSARTQGFTFIGIAVGIIIFMAGFKSAMQNSYFLGRGGK